MFASLPHAVNYFSKTSEDFFLLQPSCTSTCYKSLSLRSIQLDKTNIHHKPPMLYLMAAAAE